jgi:formylglycine-generating enzyme required for sulfatase activity
MLSSLDDKGEIELEIAESESPEAPGLLQWMKSKAATRRRRKQAADIVNIQSDESLLRDAVFLSFLSGQRADRLSVGVPQALRRLLLNLFNQGQLVLGPRTAAAGAMAMTAVLLWALWPRPLPQPGSIEQPTPTPAGIQSLTIDSVNLGNDVKLETINLSGGEFTMGGDRYDFERPLHQVRLSPFAIGKTEVTQAQWKAVMGGNPSRFQGDDRPVETVSWDDVNEFTKRLSQKTGLQFRLPTEAEWEYAARAGSPAEYSFGDDEKELGDYAWFYGNSGNTTHPVGRKKPNRFGLFDMNGNVWEWCSDWFSDSYYAECHRQGTVVDPPGPGTGSSRVFRGGGWINGAVICRSALRNYDAPGDRLDDLGFRLVRVGP